MTTRSPKNALMWRILASCVLVILLLGAGGAIFRSLLALKKPPQRVAIQQHRPGVRVLPLRRVTYQEQLTGYGRARALRHATVAAEVQGIIQWISPDLEPGSAVKAQAVLVRVDTRDLDNNLARSKAEVNQARALLGQARVEREGTKQRLAVARSELATSRQELARSERLVKDEIASLAELDKQRRATRLLERQELQLAAAFDSALPVVDRRQADLDRADATLLQAQVDLERAVIRAPYTGRIERRMAEFGARVAPGTELFQIIDLSRVEVPISLPASRFGDIEPGHSAKIRMEEGGAVIWRGKVARISPMINDRDRSFETFLVIQGTPLAALVPPGSFVVATIGGRRDADVLVVPRIAFLEDHVFVAEAEPGSERYAVARKRVPKVLRFLADVALVSGGLEAGERLIVSNLERIADGTAVKVATSSPAAITSAGSNAPSRELR